MSDHRANLEAIRSSNEPHTPLHQIADAVLHLLLESPKPSASEKSEKPVRRAPKKRGK